MAHPLNVAVVGHGISGIATALHLQRLGHRVVTFERAGSDMPTGAGLLLHPPAVSLLEELGLGDAALARGSRVDHLKAETRSGRQIMNLGYGNHAVDTFAIGIQRNALLQILRSAGAVGDRVIRGRSVVSVDADRGTLILESEEEFGPYDLIVAADGADSAIRRCFPTLIARDRLYRSAALVWLSDEIEGLVEASVSQYFDGTRHVSVWPVGSSAPGEPIRVNFSINIPLSEASAFLESEQWLGVAARLCPTLEPLLGADGIGQGRPLLYTYRDVVLNRFFEGRIAFVGDAGHSMSPQLGQGVRLALQDASTLSRALHSCARLDDALRHYDAMQSARVKSLQTASRWLTPIFQSNSRILAALRDTASGPVTRIRYIENRLHTLLTA